MDFEKDHYFCPGPTTGISRNSKGGKTINYFPDNSRQLKFALLRNNAFQRKLINRCFALYLRTQCPLFSKQSETLLPGSITGRAGRHRDSIRNLVPVKVPVNG